MTTNAQLRALLIALAAVGSLTLSGCGDDKPAEEHEEEGEHVEAGDVVLLDSAGMAMTGIELATVASVNTTGLRVTGAIAYDANRVSHIGPRTAGRIVRLAADIGQRVGSGQVLATLESPEVGQLRADEIEAQALLRISRENHNRERRLEDQGISSRKELLVAEAELRRSEAALLSAQQKLQSLGAGAGRGAQFVLTAPFSGIVVARDASLGEMAEPSDQLFTVANLDRVWIELDIFERDLAQIKAGQRVDVTTTAFPNRAFVGTIVYVGDIVDADKRTVRARVEIPNSDRALRPGMFATALIQVGASGVASIVIPQDAVQELKGRKVVFIPGGKPGEFKAVPVELGATSEDGTVVVISGLTAGSKIVTKGAFALRSELSKAEMAEDDH